MKASEFCYWLQGYFELALADGGNPDHIALNFRQVSAIRNHLAMVFRYDLDQKQGPLEHQAELQSLHDAGKPQIGGAGPGGQVYRC